MKLYVALAVLRLIASVLFFGMIHPDEFFQSQEVMARHILPHDSVLRRELFVPWEFQLPNVNRSILFPALVVGVPYKVLELLGVKLTGWLLLVTPRVLLCLVSFLIDVILYRIVGRLNRHQKLDIQQKKQMQAILIFASSWTTLVFMCRPFSNTFETLVLALCFGVLYLIHPSRRMGYGMLHVQTILLGSLLAIGIFTRFTFPVFFFPLGVELVRQQDTLLMITARKKDVMNSPSILRRLLTTISILIQGFIAFVSLAALFVVVDTLYFHPELFTGEVDRALFEKVAENTVIAPYNNFLYNIQYENLKQHGVHPRLTHLIINMPILFGPVFLNYLVQVLRFPDCSFFEIFSVFFPLICLSLAPHQELRFLLPLVVPLHLFTALSGRNGTKRFLVRVKFGRAIWILFNFVLTLFFGILHQGGIVPMLLSLSSIAHNGSMTNTSTMWLTSYCNFDESNKLSPELIGKVPLIYVKTYMPPRFLLAGMELLPKFQLVDFAGNSAPDLEWLSYDSPAKNSTVAFLVLPTSIGIKDISSSLTPFTVLKYGRCFPHISTEDFSSDTFSLDLYSLNLRLEEASQRP